MAMGTVYAISSPLSSKGLTAVAVAEHCSQQPALNCRSSIRSQSGRTRNLPVFSNRGFAGGDRSWITQGKSSISSVVGRAARPATGAVASAAATETSSGELEKSGDSYFVTDTRPVMLYDGVCNMCNWTVDRLLDHDTEGKLRYAALQSEAGIALLVKSGLPPDYLLSVVLVYKDRSFIKSGGIFRIGEFLQFPYCSVASVALTLPLFVRDAMYRLVAYNRYHLFGKSNECRLSAPQFAERFVE